MSDDYGGKVDIEHPTLFWILVTARCNPRLSIPEIAVLYRYYGLKQNFKKIAKQFSSRRKRIDQIHKSGLKKLKTSLQIKDILY